MGSKGVVWRPIATIAVAVGDVELEDQVLRLSRYLGYAKVLLNNFYFLGGGPALKNKEMLVPAVHVRISRYFSPRGDSSTRNIYIILVPIKFNLRRNRRSLKMARPCEHPNFLSGPFGQALVWNK